MTSKDIFLAFQNALTFKNPSRWWLVANYWTMSIEIDQYGAFHSRVPRRDSGGAGHSTVRHEPPSGWIFKSKGVLESQDAALEQWLHGFAIIRWLSRKTKQDPTKFRFGNGFARRKASNFHARYSAVRQEPPSSWIVEIEDVLESQDAALEKSRSGYMIKRPFIWRILPL